MRRCLVLLGIAGLLLTGCAGTPAPAPTVTVTAPAAVEEPSPSPTPSEDAPLVLGSTQDFGEFAMTVHAVNLDPAPAPAPQPENAADKWVSADVEYCATIDSTITSYWWRLSAADNRQYEPSSVGYSAFPEPAYAWGEVPVAAGNCHRGWITFTVNREAVLETVRYANDKGHSAEWALTG